MKKRTVIWLIVAFAVLVGAYAVIANWKAIHEHFWPTEYGPYQGDGTTILYNLGSIDDVTRIEWRIEDKSYFVYKDESGNFVTDDNARLESDTIRSELASNLYTIKASHTLEDVNKADYDLDEPWMEYTIYSGGTKDSEPKVGQEPEHHTIRFGTYNPVTETYYATMDDDPNVYLMYNKLTTHFGEYAVYAPVEAAQENAELQKMTITADGKTYVFYPSYSEDGVFYSTVFSWYTLDENGKPQAVSVDAIDALYKIYMNLAWSGVEATEVEDLSQYGLDEEHAKRIDLEYSYQTAITDDEGNTTYEPRNGQWHFLLGAERDNKTHYAMIADTGVVQYISDELTDALIHFDPKTMPYHVAVVPEWQTLKSIDITLPDGTQCLVEMRATDEGTRYFIQNVEVDKEDARAVFLSLFNPPVDGIVEEPGLSKSDAALKVHFSRNRATFAEMDLYLIPYNSSLYVVDFFDEQKYLVSGRVLDGVISAVQEALEKVS